MRLTHRAKVIGRENSGAALAFSGDDLRRPYLHETLRVQVLPIIAAKHAPSQNGRTRLDAPENKRNRVHSYTARGLLSHRTTRPQANKGKPVLCTDNRVIKSSTLCVSVHPAPRTRSVCKEWQRWRCCVAPTVVYTCASRRNSSRGLSSINILASYSTVARGR